MLSIQKNKTMDKFNNIKLNEIICDSDKGIPSILEYFLDQIKSLPNSYNTMGWQDIHKMEENENSWTFKINGYKGIYGLYFDETIQNNDWKFGYFDITYFPHPDEKLVDRLPLKAVYQTQQSNYYEKISKPMVSPELLSFFEVGRLSLAINQNDKALLLSLYALSRHKIVTIDSVSSMQSKPPPIPIEPNNNYNNHNNKNLPSFVIAYGLFKVLATTITFNVQQPPKFLQRDKRRGYYFTYTDEGYLNLEPTSWINEIELHLGYGDADFEQQVEAYAKELPEKLESVSWKTGEIYPDFVKNALWWISHKINELQT